MCSGRFRLPLATSPPAEQPNGDASNGRPFQPASGSASGKSNCGGALDQLPALLTLLR